MSSWIISLHHSAKKNLPIWIAQVSWNTRNSTNLCCFLPRSQIIWVPLIVLYPACRMPLCKKSLDSTTWNRLIHPLPTKKQPIQLSKQWTQLFNISLKHCFLVAGFEIRRTPNSNVNSSIGSWSGSLSDQSTSNSRTPGYSILAQIHTPAKT